MPGWKNGKRVREEKGNSLMGLPLDYVVVDTETTGLDPQYCGLIEASALRVRGGRVTDSFSSLIRPPKLELYCGGEWIEGYVDKFITGLTGITNEMLDAAPKPEEVLPGLADFLGEDVILGHNVNFDVSFLYDAFWDYLGQPLRNDYIDHLRIARKLLPELPHHRLSDVAAHLGVSYEGAHRSLTDCRITNECYLKLREAALKSGSEEDFLALFQKKRPGRNAQPVRPPADDLDPNHPLYGKRVAFAGKLRFMDRREAMRLVANAGGINEAGISAKTDFLVIGSTVPGGGKCPDGEAASAGPVWKGQGITVISEEAFRQMVC